MTSAAVFEPNASERSISPAVSEPNAPSAPARRTTDANSSGVRAERSSSTGSTPTRRSSWFAEPFSTATSGRVSFVNTTSGMITHTTLSTGRDKAMFFGTSSPNTICTAVANSNAAASAATSVTSASSPSSWSGPRSNVAIDGSATKPIAKLVTVIPN